MRLEAGGRLGAYEIVAPLGAGGMGEVYLGNDTRLGRQIALKILPREFAADAGRRQRLEYEAQAAARLNHPNIVTLFTFEEVDDVAFLTMEYVEGRPLSSLIGANGLPLERLLPIAIPIADAVASAHNAGIIHRDLKPGNVMVASANGRVKVLDFGLAKLHEPSVVNAGASTGTVPITADGRIAGTIAYMSPEQAEGRPTDARSDIFSLGVMLFEMATGRRPFAGDSSLSLLTAILRDTPPSVTDVKPELPIEFGRIIRRCLQKDPDRRYQTALDLRNALEELKQESDSGGLTQDHLTRGVVIRRRRPAAIAAATAAVVAVATLGLWLAWRRPGRESSSPALEIRERRVTSNSVDAPVYFAAISADGRYMAYSDIRGLHVRFIDTGETRTVPVPAEFCFT
jgi:eukaryotic-like serine/threonine-protein kinase